MKLSSECLVSYDPHFPGNDGTKNGFQSARFPKASPSLARCNAGSVAAASKGSADTNRKKENGARVSRRCARSFHFQSRRRKLGGKTKFRVYAAPAHQPSSCRRMTIARFSKAPSIIVIIVIICYDDPHHDNFHHPTTHHGSATDAGIRWACRCECDAGDGR